MTKKCLTADTDTLDPAGPGRTFIALSHQGLLFNRQNIKSTG